jgi:hypothetical protein
MIEDWIADWGLPNRLPIGHCRSIADWEFTVGRGGLAAANSACANPNAIANRQCNRQSSIQSTIANPNRQSSIGNP